MHRRKLSKKRGSALVTTFGVMALLAVGAAMYVDYATQTMRESNRSTEDVRTTNLCESGVQSILRAVWRPFKVDQHFENLDPTYNGATATNPRGTVTGQVGVQNGRFAAAVIGWTNVDPYTRNVLVRAVGWVDDNNDSTVDNGEGRKTVDVAVTFSLLRSRVFDYTYFVNNYGWMYGFSESQLIVNGDMRANGNFDFTGGSPVVNGTVVASQNSKLDPVAAGVINQAPVKWTDSAYATAQAGTAGNPERWRQAYDPARHGAIGSAQFEQWRDLVFRSQASVETGKTFGTVLHDVSGQSAWARLNSAASPTKTLLDNAPSGELVMPDLSDISRYVTLSQNYRNPKNSWRDGSANPNAGQPAYVEVWNSATNQYQRVTTNGVVTGSAVLVGTSARPIRIHGPVTVTQDVAIKGFVSGQGTIYAGRNVHVVGSLRYSNPPDERGNNPDALENQNEKRDILGLAARGSVLFGNPNNYSSPYPLYYMTPPFTKGRRDEAGNFIPPFNAMEIDGTGRRRYQSVIDDGTMNAIAEGVNQVDAVMYTNNVGGGQLGTAGGGVTINGTLISKDEAMVVYSLPLRLNYDNRIRERSATQQPLINIDLPRSPSLLRATWQEWGFSNRAMEANNNGSNGNRGRGNGNGLGLGSGHSYGNDD